VNLSKVHAELATSGSRQAERLAFLAMSGSFSPIHTQHLRGMEMARHIMLSSGWYVVGGFLVPSDDQYVSSKIGSDAWPLTRRLELCRLATEDSPWVDVTPWAEFSSFRAARRLQYTIESGCREGLSSRPLTGVMVMGSDTALRILRRALREWESPGCDRALPTRDSAQWVCCLVRPGGDGTAEMQEITMTIAPRIAPLGIKIVVSTDCSQQLMDVSSQAVRDAIERRQWDDLRDRGWLNPKVLDRLRSADE